MRGVPTANPHQEALGRLENLLGWLGRLRALFHDPLAGEHSFAQRRFLPDDADVTLDVRNLRDSLIERNDIPQAVHGLELALPIQFVRHGDPIHPLAAIVQVLHARKCAGVFRD